jgi:WD40 repeat protein
VAGLTASLMSLTPAAIHGEPIAPKPVAKVPPKAVTGATPKPTPTLATATIADAGSIGSLSYMRDGASLFLSNGNSSVEIRNAATGAVLRKVQIEGSVDVADISKDGKLIAAAYSGARLGIFDAQSGVKQHTLDTQRETISLLRFSPDGKLIVAVARNLIFAFDASTGKKLYQTRQTSGDTIGALAFSPDSKSFATGASNSEVMVWESATGTVRRTLQGHQSGVTMVAYSPDGSTLASGSHDETARLWSTRTGELQHVLEAGGPVGAVVFSPSGSSLAVAAQPATAELFRTDLSTWERVQLWDVGKLKPKLSIRGMGRARLLNFSPDGKNIAVVDDKGASIYDVSKLGWARRQTPSPQQAKAHRAAER